MLAERDGEDTENLREPGRNLAEPHVVVLAAGLDGTTDHCMKAAERLRTVEIAARRLGVSPSWLRREAAAGRLPAIQIGRSMMFDLEALRFAIKRRAQQEAEQRRGGASDA